MCGSGRLAIWNSCVAGWEAKYEHWYQSEHLIERLSVPGFERGRRYVSMDRPNAFFTYYETATPEVLTSDVYMERVNNPTPMTAEIMRHAFAEMSRTECRNLFTIGAFRGTFAAAFLRSEAAGETVLNDWAQERLDKGAIARVESWQAAEIDAAPSTEAVLRGGDDRIEACVLVEALREPDCKRAIEGLTSLLGAASRPTPVYRLLCELTAS